MVTVMEGISRPVLRIVRELSLNSRSGLTTRFLSKKLDLPIEEVEYLVDVHHSFLFTDLTKIKLVSEGYGAVKRIHDGLENYGDIPSIFRRVKTLAQHDFRWLEEQLDIDKPGAKKSAAEQLIDVYYRTPDAIVEYVATKSFSQTAREVFDIVWQSKSGIMSCAKIRAAHGGSEYEVEQALWELFRGMALFELFRFDGEDRLVRVAGLLSEIRQWRDENAKSRKKKVALRPLRIKGEGEQRGVEFTDNICRLVAAIAAKPARLRGDGELFREDRRRFSEIVPEDAEPSLNTCLWAAEGAGWLARVDNELRAAEIEKLLDVSRFDRHRIIADWLLSTPNERESRRVLAAFSDELKPKAWYANLEFVEYSLRGSEDSEQPVLKSSGGHYRYVNPSAAVKSDRTQARSLEETFFWLGMVARNTDGADNCFRLTDLGRCLLGQTDPRALAVEFSNRGAEIVVQPNFDIVVPIQDMDPLLTVPLDQFAVRQSTGSASVYQLTKESFTQALQDGHDAEAFVNFIVAHNRGGLLPANVMTTLDDWRGGLRRVRLRTMHILEADDKLVMADLMHRRKFKKFLVPLDAQKTIGYKNVSKAELTKELEKDGFIVE